MNSFLIGRALDYAMRSDRNIKNAKRNTPINLIQTAKIETEPTVFRPFSLVPIAAFVDGFFHQNIFVF